MSEGMTETGSAPAAPAGETAAPASTGAGETATGTSEGQPQPGGQPVSPGRGMFEGMLPLILMFIVIFYFVLWRPQSKQRKEREAMLAALRKGDRVVTMGGVLGQIVEISESEMTLRVDARKDVQMRFQRSAVLHVATKGSEGSGGGPAAPPDEGKR